MKLNKKTDVAIQVLLYLRNNNKIEPNYCSAHTMSNELDVSYNNIRKIISSLNELQITTSKLGQTGGISLSENYNDISIMDVLVEFEEFDPFNSQINCSICNITTSCSFDHITKRALINFFHTYKLVYLNDL